MQVFTLTAITGTEKTKLRHKNNKVNGPRNIGQGQMVKVRA